MSRRRLVAILLSVFAFLYALVWNLAQISPDDAASNLHKWWKDRVPPFLKGVPALIGVMGVLALVIVVLLWPEIKKLWRLIRSSGRRLRFAWRAFVSAGKAERDLPKWIKQARYQRARKIKLVGELTVDRNQWRGKAETASGELVKMTKDRD
ncbi:MAG TPA: hypothetical protein VGQ44_17515, partial [Gemmatimonadaceae bacterium]|nr:hypothetical protein [Gemmatimonadaceae bacterium]